MFIELDDKLLQELQSIQEDSDGCFIALDQIFYSMQNMNHIVYASRKMLDELCNVDFVSNSNKEYIRQLCDHFSEIYSPIKATFNHRVVVNSCNGEFSRDGNKFYFPLSQLRDIRRCKLLVENESDGHVYIDISLNILASHMLDRQYGICVDNDSFGGASVRSKICELSGSNLFMMVIVDSDKSFPNDRKGDTCRAAFQVYNCVEKNNAIAIYVLGVREKENIIPPFFYMAISESKRDILKILNKYPEKYIFWDIKDGIKNSKFTDNQWKKFYNCIINECVENNVIINDFPEGIDRHSDYLRIDGIGGRIANQVDALLLAPEEMDREGTDLDSRISHFGLSARKDRIIEIRNNIFLIPDCIKSEWENVYSYLWDFGCCLKERPWIMSSES